MSQNVVEIFTDQILDPKHAMRTEMDRDALHDLADNIKQNGLINPITVRPVEGGYEVVAGHRRLSACKIAGKIKIQCVVRELSDNEVFAIKASENLERADVDPVDESIFITEYIEQTGLSIPEVAKTLRRSVEYVKTRLDIGKMPDYLQTYLKRGEVKLGVAIALMDITDPDILAVYTDMAVKQGVTTGQARYWVDGWKLQVLSTGSGSSSPQEGYVPGAPKIIMFECAIDGEKYDARQFQQFLIHESNVPSFQEFVSHVRNLLANPESSPGAQ